MHDTLLAELRIPLPLREEENQTGRQPDDQQTTHIGPGRPDSLTKLRLHNLSHHMHSHTVDARPLLGLLPVRVQSRPFSVAVVTVTIPQEVETTQQSAQGDVGCREVISAKPRVMERTL